jgi:hypothetical protein
MADLTAKIVAARRRWVEVPGHPGWGFEIQRPTEYDLAELRARGGKDKILNMVALVKAHVVGWRGLAESDLVPGGSGDAPPFTAEVFAGFIEDRPKLWAPLAQAIWTTVLERERELEQLRGN